MRKLKPLFVSYFYPPAGGSGLPGSQRSVKFIRYLRYTDTAYVLTLKPECYSDGLLLDFDLDLPVNNEIIVRVESKDRFCQAMHVRSKISRLITKTPDNSEPGDQFVQSEGMQVFSRVNQSFAQRFKDFIHDFYYFPDQIAGPWLNYAVKEGVRLVKNEKINIIFATGMPWTALVAGRLIAKETGVPFIADFRDPWLGNPFLESKGWLLDWRERVCEQRVIEEAALVTANTVPLRQEFVQRYPHVAEDKIISLPNGFDRSDFVHISDKKDFKNTGRKKLVLMHAGFLYGKRDPAPLLDAIELLSRKNPGLSQYFEFQQFGGISSLGYDIKQRYKMLFDQGLVKTFGSVPHCECLEKLNEADILVIIQPGTKTQVPSKLYDYLCINRPVITITPPDGALGNMVREEGFGILFAPEETERLAGKLRELCFLKKENRLQLTPDYPERDRYDVCYIAHLLEEKMMQIISCR